MQRLTKFDHKNIVNIINELELYDIPQRINLELESEVLNYFLDKNKLELAIAFLTLGMPRREVIWWGYLAAQTTDSKNPDARVQNTLRLCEQWVHTPTEELRRQAKSAADSLDLSTASSWVAMAIFWSGNNIAAVDSPHCVNPSEFMTGHAVSNAICQSIASYNDKAKEKTLHFLRQGLHIAMGGNGKI